MSTISILIVIVFVLGYVFIATESLTKINKAAVALLMLVFCWTLYMMNPLPYVQALHPNFIGDNQELMGKITEIIQGHLGDASTTLFFLMGAMAIVEIVDQNGGFNWVRRVMTTKSKRKLLWELAFMTFFLSAILDNMTTSIVMIMILRMLVPDRNDRMIYASLVIIAANSGGAFSPIGDVTTIMLWNKGLISALGIISEMLVPSIVSLVVPVLVLQYSLNGSLQVSGEATSGDSVGDFTRKQRKIVFALGVGGLVFVPVFKSLTNLPPFVGILLVLGVLWTVTEYFYSHLHYTPEVGGTQKRVANLLSHLDMATILFFLGILMAVSCLQEIGMLSSLGKNLDSFSGGNHYIVTGIIGILSSIVDNVPLVAGCMGMYPMQVVGDMAADGIFWQLLAYCAGVGGSILIIGSAAGVVVMGLEKITFGWYLKRVSWAVLLGYGLGMFSYWIIKTLA